MKYLHAPAIPPREPLPDFFLQIERKFPLPHRGPIRRGVKRLMFTAIENGWFGLRPLKTHVVICGFPRSGSTLLLLIAQACLADATVYNEERGGEGTARNPLMPKNRSYMISKAPWDVFYIDEILAMYASRRANVRFILTKRDPRAVLVSHHSEHPGGYFLSSELWHAFYKAFRRAQHFDGAITVAYEDLVQHPGEVEREITEFIGWTARVPFEQFHAHLPPDLPASTLANLNGLRGLDSKGLASWRRPEHRERIRSLLQELPDLPQYLIEMGYETDTSWTRPYIE